MRVDINSSTSVDLTNLSLSILCILACIHPIININTPKKPNPTKNHNTSIRFASDTVASSAIGDGVGSLVGNGVVGLSVNNTFVGLRVGFIVGFGVGLNVGFCVG